MSEKQSKSKKTLNQTVCLSLIYKALGDKLRLEILRVLSHESFGVQELAYIFNSTQPGMSHHLRILANSGLVVTRRQGTIIFYSRPMILFDDIQEPSGNTSYLYSIFRPIFRPIFQAIDDLPLAPKIAERILKVHEKRAKASSMFFKKHADRFSEQQGLLCETRHYLPQLITILQKISLSGSQGLAIEVGPGHGELLKELQKLFSKVIAIENSEEMLSLAQTLFKKPKFSSDQKESGVVTWFKGDFHDFDLPSKKVDAIILNMVLHHIPSPRKVFAKASELLAYGGYLAIADLCLHEQEWTRESCGDLWPGFDPNELKSWGNHYHFNEVESVYIGLKNGFQVQIRLFQLGPTQGADSKRGKNSHSL